MSRPVSLLLAGVTISAFGTGLTMPYVVVYLTHQCGLSLRGAGDLLGLGGLLGLLAIPVAGRALDGGKARAVLPTALSVCAAGSAVLAIWHQKIGAGLGVVLVAAGIAAVWPTTATLIGRLVQGDPSSVFTAEYALLNVGIGGGSFTACLILQRWPSTGYQVMYVFFDMRDIDAAPPLRLPGMTARQIDTQAGDAVRWYPGLNVTLALDGADGVLRVQYTEGKYNPADVDEYAGTITKLLTGSTTMGGGRTC